MLHISSVQFSFLDVAAEQRVRGNKGKSSGSLNYGCSGSVKLFRCS
jgi:hypothetical protein